MSDASVDDIDKQLLHHLQRDGRMSAVELAERLEVSDNTVRNRMHQLEDAGVIIGYTAETDYRKTDFELCFMFVCTARISDRRSVAENIRELPRVIEVTELMTGQRNLHIKAVGTDDQEITTIAERIDGLNLEINDEILIREEHKTPVDYTAIKENE
ncbi:MAG: Lrp/AsnC family transcriptional regulator [Halolamina sp.]